MTRSAAGFARTSQRNKMASRLGVRPAAGHFATGTIECGLSRSAPSAAWRCGRCGRLPGGAGSLIRLTGLPLCDRTPALTARCIMIVRRAYTRTVLLVVAVAVLYPAGLRAQERMPP